MQAVEERRSALIHYPSSLRRAFKYASLLRISCALNLGFFTSLKKEFFNGLIVKIAFSRKIWPREPGGADSRNSRKARFLIPPRKVWTDHFFDSSHHSSWDCPVG